MSISDTDTPVTARRRTGPWGTVVSAVMRDPLIPAPTKALYALLATYAGGEQRSCWPSRETLAQQMGCSVPTIDRHIQALEELGILEKASRYRENGSQTANEYLLLDDQFGGASPVKPLGATPVRGEGATPVKPPRGTGPVEQDQRKPPPAVAVETVEVDLFGATVVLAPSLPPEASANGCRRAFLGAWEENHGHIDPSIRRRACGVITNLCKHRETLEDWKALWDACQAAGRAGRWDVAAHLAPAPRNRYVTRDPHMDRAQEAAAAGLLDSMLGALESPRAISGRLA